MTRRFAPLALFALLAACGGEALPLDPTDAGASGDACAPACAERQCGPDGCGGSCGPGCSGGDVCDEAGRCVADPCASKTCPNSLPSCNSLTGACECTSVSCGSGLLCDPASHACKTGAELCSGKTCDGERPECSTATGACVCTATSCSAGRACDLATGLCQACSGPGCAAPDAGVAPDAGGDPCAQPVQTIVGLQAVPATLTLARDTSVDVSIRATFASGCVRDISTVYLAVSNPAVVEAKVNGSAVSVRGLAKGSATVTASSEPGGQGVVSNPIAVTVTDGTTPPTYETRGVWVTRFAYSKAADVQGIINRAADAGFNAVFFQVRGVGDAYYKSALVPWRKGSNALLGKDPGWDPLQVAVTAAHARGIQLHAYLNAMSGWTKTGTTPQAIPDSEPGAPLHILKQHPEWACLDSKGVDSSGEYTYIAAEPGYRAHLVAVVEEVLANYDVDGIHLDRIRTPGSGYCHSPGLDAAYKAKWGTDTSHFADFQREQINLTVKAIHDAVVAKKPKVVFSAAVWGIYKKLAGCSTSQGYSDYYQDSLAWTAGGYIDMLNPMIYWALQPGGCTDWGALVDSFAAGMNGRLLVAGMHALDGNPDKVDFPKVKARIDYARQKKIAGTVVFASTYFDATTYGDLDGMWNDFKAGPYAQPAPPTPITHR